MFLRTLDSLLQGEERFYETITESMSARSPEQRAPSAVSRAPEIAAPSSPAYGAQRTADAAPVEDLKYVAAAYALVRAHRNFGHLAAHLDPLGSEPPGDPSLDIGRLGLTPEIMAGIPAEVLPIYLPGQTPAAAHGTRKTVIGMAHRGRLNVLAHVVNVSYETILAEFEGGRREETAESEGWNAGTGDVKYHHGAEGVYHTASGKDMAVTLSPNPSHLESVNPVVEGRARANQTNRGGAAAEHDVNVALPVLLHGDAAFAGQGVVAETFNLARLRGYTTGGTIHLILNNQIGFTTDPREGRSTDYSSDLAKGFDAPIVHVNADDPEACLAAVRLAMLYRDKFHADVGIDVVGGRRCGPNEAHRPGYPPPLMVERGKRAA